MNPESLHAELKRRKVPRVAGVYVAAGLGTIYAADAILPGLGLPDWTVTLVIVLVGLGFPLAIGLAWAFDITPAGVTRTPDREAPETPSVDARVQAPSGAPYEGAPATQGVDTTSTSVAPAAALRGRAPTRPAIVVLPFADMSPGADHEYFSDGLTEEVIADLAGIHSLAVISRTSAMQFRNTDLDVRSIGRTLGVRYVLEGSVRKAGDRLRITAQLIDAHTDEHLWADKYDGSIEDMFDVQERVSREIVRALDVTLTKGEDERLSDRPIADVRAFELYLKARRQLQRHSNEGVAELLAEAVAIEGRTPPLQALEAWALVNEVRTGVNRDLRPLDDAEQIAKELLELAPQSHYGHALLGYSAYERGDLPRSAHHFRAALELEPDDADAMQYLGFGLNMAGQVDSAMAVSLELMASDPLGPMSHVLSGATSMFLGEFESASRHCRRAIELDPDNLIARWCAGYTRALAGDTAEATHHADWMSQNGPPDFPYTTQLRTLLDGTEGRPEKAREALAGVETQNLDAHHRFHLAESFAMAGEVDRALDLLEQSVEDGFYATHFIEANCPFMDPLKGSPRFAAVVAASRRRSEGFPKA
jgi:TolB-like protein/Flp pilus assembly protein TadD